MLHLVLYGVLAIAVAGGLFALAARFLPAGEQIAPPVRDEPPWELPDDRALSPDEIDAVRLPVALRGYRFAETDVLLDRLAAELRARDAEIARLRGDAAPAFEAPTALPFAPPERSPYAPPQETPDAAPAPYAPPQPPTPVVDDEEQLAEALAVDEGLRDAEPAETAPAPPQGAAEFPPPPWVAPGRRRRRGRK